jgi:hypothetical protein
MDPFLDCIEKVKAGVDGLMVTTSSAHMCESYP